ncbi:MAG: hypothetical protein JW878_02315 [Methanomicrobia archaeon]|nr:hypothetical protein [Methanomicrobia archaeon]
MRKENLNLILCVVCLIVTVVGFGIAIWQLNLTLYQTEYPDLNITHQIDKENGFLKITLENTASRKETGTINFYRLEVSDSKPHLQLESLNPGDNTSFFAAISVDEKYYNVSDLESEYPTLTAFELPGITRHKLYMITENTSISYKITCDNCHPQGFVKRIPDWETIETGFAISRTGSNYTVNGTLPIYSWVTYTPEDLP